MIKILVNVFLHFLCPKQKPYSYVIYVVALSIDLFLMVRSNAGNMNEVQFRSYNAWWQPGVLGHADIKKLSFQGEVCLIMCCFFVSTTHLRLKRKQNRMILLNFILVILQFTYFIRKIDVNYLCILCTWLDFVLKQLFLQWFCQLKKKT